MDVRRLETAEGTLIAERVVLARSFARRTLGLMFRRELAESEGLAIVPCNQIHMFFMRIPLDVLFVNREGQVLHLLHGIRPWRMSKLVRGARYTIELPVGTLRRVGVERGAAVRLV
ncbi:MAG: hypothetical protein NVS3B18_03280 [Candidatus Dormibacteria bacterium]